MRGGAAGGGYRFSTKLDVPLVGDVDLDEVLSHVVDHRLKGLFFTRYVGEAFPAVEKRLVEPPARGRYHAFESYPMADYTRLFDHVARARFPGSAREAYRLLGRGEVEVFAESTLGKVTLSMLGDPGAALLRYPDVLGMVLKGLDARSKRTGPKSVLVWFEQPVGSVDQIVGVLEGITMVYDASPVIDVEVEIDARLHTSFAISW